MENKNAFSLLRRAGDAKENPPAPEPTDDPAETDEPGKETIEKVIEEEVQE